MLLTVLSRVFTPFLVAPGVAAVSVMMFAVDARAQWRACIVAHAVAVLGPWVLELAGVLSTTTTARLDGLLLTSATVANKMPGAAIALVTYTLALIVVAGYISHRVAMSQRSSMQSIELQAWHLRQLVKH